MKATIAFISGTRLDGGPGTLYENARLAHTLYQRGYVTPIALPSPKISYEMGNRSVRLKWGYEAGGGIDLREVWDDANPIASVYPLESWRRRNPPEGHSVEEGGRIFEGFRLYRSESPIATASSFVLLRQWDMVDDVGPRFEYETGTDTTFTDSNLVTNKTYWYALTSFGLPDQHSIQYLTREREIRSETLRTAGGEGSVLASRKRINLPFSVAESPGKVLVVPNPYRTDADYSYENGGWEGRGSGWTENKRMIKFIHLPAHCTIRVYSLSGDVVTTLRHDNEQRGELAWNLLSESGRAIASGVYLFSVEADEGGEKQIGKFVIIR